MENNCIKKMYLIKMVSIILLYNLLVKQKMKVKKESEHFLRQLRIVIQDKELD